MVKSLSLWSIRILVAEFWEMICEVQSRASRWGCKVYRLVPISCQSANSIVQFFPCDESSIWCNRYSLSDHISQLFLQHLFHYLLPCQFSKAYTLLFWNVNHSAMCRMIKNIHFLPTKFWVQSQILCLLITGHF